MSSFPNQGVRVLLVDDDPSIRTLYSRALSLAGFDVRTAPDGREALSTTGAFEPDLIILDLIMPEQEGIETLLKLQSSYPKIPVIAISGALGASEYLHVANLLGASRTLQKPIKAEQIVESVRQILQEMKQQDAGKSAKRKDTNQR